MVEFALVIPILCVVLFGVIQFGILYKNYVTLTDAARIGARKAAVSAARRRSRSRARRPSGTGAAASTPRSSASPSPTPRGSTARTSRSLRPIRTAIDLLGFVVAAGDLKAETTERVE